MKPSQLSEAFRAWVGVPWVHQGRTRFGIDCGGLIVTVLSEARLLPKGFEDPEAYGREPQAGLSLLIERWCERMPLGLVSQGAPEGTLILLRWAPSQDPSHVAYCAGRNLIHAYSRRTGRTIREPASERGKVVEHRYGEPWLRQTAGVYRVPGVDYE